MSYLVSGNNPAAIKTAERNIFTATASQTTFTISQGYQPGDIDVFLNGVRLVDSDDYYATNGSTVVLTSGAAVGDSLVVVCYRPYQVTDFYTKSEQDTRYVNATGDNMTGPMQIWNSAQSSYSTTLADSVTTSTLQLRTHSTDSTLTTFGVISGGDGYIQRSNGPGTGSYNLRLNPYGGAVLMPNQPAFRASITSGYTLTTTTVKFGTGLLTEVFDTSNSFNHTAATFQAPVTGRYMFAVHWAPNTTGRMNTFFYVNGVANAGGSVASANGGASVSTLVQLAAGDTFEIYWQSATGANISVDNSGIYYGYMVG